MKTTNEKVDLDQKQIKQTNNKPILTVCFLPVIFAFFHWPLFIIYLVWF